MTIRMGLMGDVSGFGAERAHAPVTTHLQGRNAGRELVKLYEKVNPLAVLPIHQRLVENELVEAGAQHYRLAARRLSKMRKLASGSDQAVEVDQLVAELRETHRRRPRLQQEFDRAGLPREGPR